MKPMSGYQKQALGWLQRSTGTATRCSEAYWRIPGDTRRMISNSTMEALERRGLVRWLSKRVIKHQDNHHEQALTAELVATVPDHVSH